MRRVWAAMVTATLAGMAAAGAARAESEAEADIGTFSLTLENDLFSNKDNHYTNGIRAAYVSTPKAVPDWLFQAATALPFFPDHGQMRAGFALGQSMFTPSDIRLPNPPRDDRPYAGWAYVAAGLVADTGERLDSVELSLGVVGPASYAEEAQKIVHEIVGSPEPRGWDSQLENEPAILLTWQRQWRQALAADIGGFSLDVTPHVGGAVGNVYVYANAGATVRFGWDLPHDYGPLRIQPSLPGSGFFVPQRGIGWYLFAGLEGRLVAHDMFLEGNTFGGRDTAIDRIPAVADLQAGIALAWGPVRLAYTHVVRTPEFQQQDGVDHFGAVSVSLRF